MRLVVLAFVLAGCGRISFEPLADGAVGDDAAIGDDAAAYDPCDVANLVACYRFDGDAIDHSSNANDATTLNVNYGDGRHADAIYLGPTSDVAVTGSTDFFVAAFTIDTWVWFDALPSSPDIAVIFDNDTSYSLQIEPDGRFSCFVRLGSLVIGAQTMSTGRWVHLACAWTGSELIVYVDGVEDGGASGPFGPVNPGGAIGLGVEAPDPMNQTIGRLDSMRIWNIALDANEIRAAMN